jgi:hypothetical protein
MTPEEFHKAAITLVSDKATFRSETLISCTTRHGGGYSFGVTYCIRVMPWGYPPNTGTIHFGDTADEAIAGFKHWLKEQNLLAEIENQII